MIILASGMTRTTIHTMYVNVFVSLPFSFALLNFTDHTLFAWPPFAYVHDPKNVL